MPSCAGLSSQPPVLSDHGITPQICLERGVQEYRFAAEIEQAFSQPYTIGVGYNSIRFDDEFTRFLFWRNLIDPYAREWQNNCGRWDLLDLARAAYALRPDGIEWPKNNEGRPSFRLEDLAAANGLLHESAHDALSDVRATLALARLIRDKQPRLFDFSLNLRNKDKVADEIGLQRDPALRQPFLHVSGQFAVERGCLAMMIPLGRHPTNRNEIIAWDLSGDPAELLALDADAVRARMFTKASELPEGVSRLPIKSIHLNRSPMVISQLRTLSPEQAERWGMDTAAAQKFAEIAATPAFVAKMETLWREVYQQQPANAVDVDEDLYGGFVSNADRRQLNRARSLAPQALATTRISFEDGRLEELLFRYRARNFPETLSPEDTEQWRAHCASRVRDGADGAYALPAFMQDVASLTDAADAEGKAVLNEVSKYAQALAGI